MSLQYQPKSGLSRSQTSENYVNGKTRCVCVPTVPISNEAKAGRGGGGGLHVRCQQNQACRDLRMVKRM